MRELLSSYLRQRIWTDWSQWLGGGQIAGNAWHKWVIKEEGTYN